MLTEKDKNIILDKLIQSFNNTGYIADVCFNDCDDEDFETSVTVIWNCDDITYNSEEYSIHLSTPDFCSYEDVEYIPNEFDEGYIQIGSYIEIYDSVENICGYYDLTELSQEQFNIIFNKIKSLIKENNEKAI